LRIREFVREHAEYLQAQEVYCKVDVQRNAARPAHLVEESIKCNGARARIRNRWANQPHRSSIGTSKIQLAFLRTSNRLKIVIELIGRLNDGRS